MEIGGGTGNPTLAMELLTTDRCWERESRFSLKVLFLVSQLLPVKICGQQDMDHINYQMALIIHI